MPSFGVSLPRRRFLGTAGGVLATAALGPVLSACGREPAAPAGIVHVANGPQRVDAVASPDGGTEYPSLRGFTRETGILVDYREVVLDAAGFTAQVRPYLVRDEPTGWDVIVIRNGPTLGELLREGLLEELPLDRRPHFDDHALPTVEDPAYDPGSRHTMAWRSGMTGIAYDPAATERRVTSLGDLFTREFAGRVGMLGDAVDMPNLAIVAVGADPASSTPVDWDRAAELLQRQREAGVVVDVGGDPVGALRTGRVAVSLARSSDVYRANEEGASLQFVVPDEGGLLWTDAMCIPRRAADPVSAMRFMDHVYRPDVAAQIATSGAYLSPVRGARERLLGLAAKQEDETRARELRAIAASPLAFPTDDDLSRLWTSRDLRDEGEAARWAATFGAYVSAAEPSSS
ncbi:MAG TPA: extracellular solute-binding protein [Actinomycetota bacterium]